MPSFFKIIYVFPTYLYMKKKASFYYIIGSIVEIISIIVIAVFAFLPSAMKENFAKYESFLGWICVIFVILGLLGAIFGIYLLKKGNFIRLNNSLLNKDDKNDKNKDNN